MSILRSITTIAITTFILGSTALAKDVIDRCGGSDGPKPLIDITSQFDPGIYKIPTSGAVSEFLVWEKKNALIYRNTDKLVFGRKIGGMVQHYYGRSENPISRLVDPGESMFLASGVGEILDASSKQWKKFGPGYAGLEHLYWGNGKLITYYSHNYKGAQGQQVLEFHRYGEGENGEAPFCSWAVPTGETYNLARGSQFPYVYFYSEGSSSGRGVLRLEKFDLRKCDVVTEYNYANVAPLGEIRDVIRYEDTDQVAIYLQRDKYDLLLDRGVACTFYDIEAPEVVALHTEHPMLAAWGKKEGLNLYYLGKDNVKKARVLDSFNLDNISSEDFWLTKDNRLFFRPNLAHGDVRAIFMINLSYAMYQKP